MVRRIISSFVAVVFFLTAVGAPAYAQNGGYVEIAQYACQVGVRYLEQGRIDDALYQFRVALAAQPDHETALCYIREIEKLQRQGALIPGAPDLESQLRYEAEQELRRLRKETAAVPFEPLLLQERETPREQAVRRHVRTERSLDREQLISDYLDQFQSVPAAAQPVGIPSSGTVVKTSAPGAVPVDSTRYIPPLEIFLTDESLAALRQPVELELNRSIILRGVAIDRFLVTQPEVLTAEKITQRDIKVTGQRLGYTYIHLWDSQQRKTLEFLIVPQSLAGLTLAEEMRQDQERSKNFTLDYTIDWSLYEQGRRLNELDRQSYSWRHYALLRGETPYGFLDSGLSASTFSSNTDVTYYTLGLSDGRYGPFKGFSLRAFDFNSGIDTLVYGGTSLRGFLLKSPLFEDTFDYTAFWGREGGGIYRGLSPGITEGDRDSYVSGFNLRFHPTRSVDYEASVFKGSGSERGEETPEYGYGLKALRRYKLGAYEYNLGFDSETYAHLFDINLGLPRFKLNTEFRETPVDFSTMTGLPSRSGEIGFLNTVFWQPLERLDVNSRLDLYRDRLFPNESSPERWNQDYSQTVNYRLSDLSGLNVDYAVQNNLGKIAPNRSYAAGAGAYKIIPWKKRVHAFLNYRFFDNDSFTTDSLDYYSNKVIGGLRLELTKTLYWYINQEVGWVYQESAQSSSSPRAYETGLDWTRQIDALPLFTNFRLTFRDEEDADSDFSFLSGQDYLEGFVQLSYRPTRDTELFLNSRMRNIWADNPDVDKRIDLDFFAGLRYHWDTGVRWESVGDVMGYVFKDKNADGLRQDSEQAIDGVKVWLGRDKFQLSNKSGYFIFRKVRARTVSVSLDAMSIPAGFTPTGPIIQETGIEHGKTVEVLFGLATRVEISGVVFEDVDGDQKLGTADLPVRGAALRLNGKETTTDDFGRYAFRHIEPGMHTLSVDINSIPVIYLPLVPLKKDFEFLEGSSFQYSIPLRKTSK